MNENLRALCAAEDDPLWKIAAGTGIHPSALSKYLHGHRAIGDKHAEALASYFDVSVGAIRGAEEIPYAATVKVREV